MGQIVGNVMSFATAGAQYKQDKAAVDAQRLLQREGNQLEAAKSSLQYTLQSISNKRRLEAGGDQYAAIATGLSRWMDSYTKGSVQQQVAAAEQMGALVTGASAAGQGGGSIERIKRAMSLQQATATEDRRVQMEQTVGDQTEAAGNQMKNAIMGLSNDNFFARLDYTQYLDPIKPTSWGEALLTGGLGGIMLGLPQAGDEMARQALRGNIQNGATQFGQTIGNAIEQVAKIAIPALQALPSSSTPSQAVSTGLTPQPAGMQPYGAAQRAAINNIGTSGVKIGI